MARRGENIYKRKDGRYEGRYIKGRKTDGKPLFGYIYSHSYSEVKAALTLVKSKACRDFELTIIGKGSMDEFLNFWLENCAKNNVKPSSFAQYHDRVTRHILPELGGLAVSKFKREQAQRLVENLGQKGLAPATVRSVICLLRCAMKKAVEMRLTAVNPCDGLALPKPAPVRRRALSRVEQIRLENALADCGTCCETGVLLALYTGLRIGEICALRWQDIDLNCDLLTVRGTLQRVKTLEKSGARTKIIIGSPKSAGSNRTIPLPKAIADKLRKIYGGANDCFVITGTTAPVEPHTLRAKYNRLAKSAGLDVPFHTLRHTFATRCLEHNFDVQTLSELLGHANAGVTMKVYAHSVFEHKRRLTRRIRLLSEVGEPAARPSPAVSA